MATATKGYVDRKNNVIHGYVCAQCGEFKTPGRGKFNEMSLTNMISIWPSGGLRSRFTHPNLFNDGLGRFLGRSKNPRIECGKLVADLHLDPSSFKTPNGNLGEYLMTLAESDPNALSSSLVIEATKIFDLDSNGRPMRDSRGEVCAPLWMPTKLHASDVVDTGEAVDGFLSRGDIGLEDLRQKELQLMEIKGRFLAGELGVKLPKTIAQREAELNRIKAGWR